MQGKGSLSQRLNLTRQIELCKNYHQHRQRLDATRYKEPLKKSISFDEQKDLLLSQLKSRKLRTTQFNQREQTRRHEEQDSRMLRKILEYDRKVFVFSLNPERPNPTLLHHHSRLANLKQEERIDQENQKIHFRITHAKSLYHPLRSHTPTSTPKIMKTFQLTTNHSSGKLPPKRKFYTNNNEEEEEAGLIKNASQFSKVGRGVREEGGTSESRLSLRQGGKYPWFSNSSSLCERARREKLAGRLHEKKLKFQSTVMSRLRRK